MFFALRKKKKLFETKKEQYLNNILFLLFKELYKLGKDQRTSSRQKVGVSWQVPITQIHVWAAAIPRQNFMLAKQ